MVDSLGTDCRAVSEQAGVAALIALTLLATASVGVSVLFFDTGPGTVEANFSYSYQSGTDSLFVTFEDGDEVTAGEVTLAGPAANVSWAALTPGNATRVLTQGDVAVLSSETAYGAPVAESDTVRIYHDPEAGNRTQLSTWSAPG